MDEIRLKYGKKLKKESYKSYLELMNAEKEEVKKLIKKQKEEYNLLLKEYDSLPENDYWKAKEMERALWKKRDNINFGERLLKEINEKYIPYLLERKKEYEKKKQREKEVFNELFSNPLDKTYRGRVVLRLNGYPLRNYKKQKKGFLDIVMAVHTNQKGQLVRRVYINVKPSLNSPLDKILSTSISARALWNFLKYYRMWGRIPPITKKPIHIHLPKLWKKYANYKVPYLLTLPRKLRFSSLEQKSEKTFQ